MGARRWIEVAAWVIGVAALGVSSGSLVMVAMEGYRAGRMAKRMRAMRSDVTPSFYRRLIGEGAGHIGEQRRPEFIRGRTLSGRLSVVSSHRAAVVLIVASCLVTALLSRSVALGLAAAVATASAVAQVRQVRQDATGDALRQQLPSLFSGLSSSVGAGMSLTQALARASEAAAEPLASELRSVVSAVSLGTPLLEALDQFSARVRAPELEAAIVGIGIQHTAGGGMVRVLDQAAHQLRQGDSLRRAVKSHTAQGKMTLRMVTFVPMVLAALMAVLSEDYVAMFTGTPAGKTILAVAIAFEALGALSVSRLLRVRT